MVGEAGGGGVTTGVTDAMTTAVGAAVVTLAVAAAGAIPLPQLANSKAATTAVIVRNIAPPPLLFMSLTLIRMLTT